ncbi:MAG: MBL fold metallo-hydrolase [Gemmatimonadaceae bacterium]|nr:MBL fold metallo-hydrolase [Gemmatimonadaceae bacterium]
MTDLPSRRTAPYRNRSGSDVDPSGVLTWMVTRLAKRLPRPPKRRIVGVTPDLARLHANRREPTFTWIGHSTSLIQLGGANILTDPIFSRFASPVPFAGPMRHQPPGIALRDLPQIDIVLLSHAHYDHLDLPSMRALMRQTGGPPLFLVPAGIDRWFARNVRGTVLEGPTRNVIGLEWDEHTTGHGPAPELAFHFLPVQHWANRSPFTRNDTPWGSWAILHPEFRFWFSGDLGYSDDPARIGERFGPFDAAAIAIGAYEPRWFMRPQHVNPEEAVQVLLDVKAARAFGIHWGTFPLTDEPLDQPPEDLKAAVAARGLPEDRFTVLRHGETRPLTPAPR